MVGGGIRREAGGEGEKGGGEEMDVDLAGMVYLIRYTSLITTNI